VQVLKKVAEVEVQERGVSFERALRKGREESVREQRRRQPLFHRHAVSCTQKTDFERATNTQIKTHKHKLAGFFVQVKFRTFWCIGKNNLPFVYRSELLNRTNSFIFF